MAGSLVPGQPLPPQPDQLIRRIEAIERNMRELGPSIAKSFTGTVQDLTEAQARISESTRVELIDVALDTNSSATLSTEVYDRPSWANYAFVTVSYSVESGSTTREAHFPVDVLVTDSPSLGQNFVTAADGAFTDSWWEPNTPSTPVAVDLSQVNGAVEVTPKRTVTASGSGDLYIYIFVHITWIE